DFTLTIYTRLAEPEIREESRTEESKKESIRTRRLKAMRALAGRDLILNYRNQEIREAMQEQFIDLLNRLNSKICPDRGEAMLLELYRSLTPCGYSDDYREVMAKYWECSGGRSAF
nr:hypothetical protein [Endozoicomonas sp.]